MVDNKVIEVGDSGVLVLGVKTSEMTEEVRERALGLLTVERREKVERKCCVKDKNNCIAVGLLLNYAVSRYVELAEKWCDSKNNEVIEGNFNIICVTVDELIENYDKAYDYKVATKENGKPYFIEHEDIYFNLSHSGEYAVCVIGNVENGIDIEGKRENVLKTAKRFFAENEYNWILEGISEQDRLVRFLRLWTLKESYSKVTGKGIAYGIKEALFTADSDRISFVDKEKDRKYRIYQGGIEEYVITIICEKPQK